MQLGPTGISSGVICRLAFLRLTAHHYDKLFDAWRVDSRLILSPEKNCEVLRRKSLRQASKNAGLGSLE